MFKVTQLVHYHVVQKLRRQVYHAVVKVEVATLGAATPAATMVFDKHLTQRKVVKLVKEREPRVHSCTRGLFVL